MSRPILRICLTAALLLMPLICFAQENAEAPPTPQFQSFPANAQYTVGNVRLLYVGPTPNYYVQLSKMPEGVDYFRIKVDELGGMTQYKLKAIQMAAEYGWQVGIYHQPRLTTNFVDAAYVVAIVPAREPK